MESLPISRLEIMSDKKLTDFEDLLVEKNILTVLSVPRDNKGPHATPVWFKTTKDGIKRNEITFNSNKSRMKGKLIHKGTPVTMTFLDPENIFRYITLSGTVSQVIDGQEAVDHINELSKKYLGKDYPNLQPGEQRVKYVLKVSSIY